MTTPDTHETVVRTACWECYNNCGVCVHVRDGRVTRISGDPEHPLNRLLQRPFICAKGMNAHRYTYSEKRIKHPLRRKVDGTFERISWDEALNTIADRLHETAEKYGPTSIMGYGVETFYERGVFWNLFLRQMGTPNLMVYGDFCGATTQYADVLTAGERFTRYHYGLDFANSDFILLVASNLAVSHPNQWAHVELAKARGARLVVVDPRYCETAEAADTWLQIRPGSDMALGLAMANVIIAEQLYDKDFVKKWTTGFPEFSEHVRQYTPEWAETLTWVKADQIREIARAYATTPRACLARKIGTAHNIMATQTARIFTILIALTGHIDVPGGNLLIKSFSGYLPPTEYYYGNPEWRNLLPQEVEDQQFGAKMFPLYSGSKAINRLSSNTASFKAMLHGRVKAMFAIGTNPVSSMPNSHQVEEAIKKVDFFAIASHTMSPTTQLAHIVLPLTTWLEESTPLHDQFTHCLVAGPAAIEPVGEAKTAMQIMIEITNTQKAKGYIDKVYIKWRNMEEYYDERLSGTGLTYAQLKKSAVIPYEPTYRDYEKRGFRTPSGKVELYSETLAQFGQDPMPTYVEPPFTPLSDPALAREYPLILITGSREKNFYLTKHREMAWARRTQPYPELEINTETARGLGIANGDWVFIETPWAAGQCVMKAKCEDRMHPQVVHAPFGWYFPEKAGYDPHRFNINSVLPNDPPYEGIIGIPTLKPLLCKVRKAEGVEDWYTAQ